MSRKLIFTYIFAILAVPLLMAQDNSSAIAEIVTPPTIISGSTNRNYVSKAVFTQSVGKLTTVSPARAIINTTYYDGFGRKQQTVLRNNNSGKDLADYYEYDTRGRVMRQYLPGSISGSGNYASLDQITASHVSLYPEDATNAYISIGYDASVTPRAITTHKAGTDWHASAGTRSQYHINKTSGKYSCNKYMVKDGSLYQSGEYPSGRLHVTSIIDEDNHETIIFKDFNDSTYLHRRVLDENIYADTYYVYDQLGNIRYVIPPMASDTLNSLSSGIIPDNNKIINDYCYIYKYDNRNRLEEKKHPGAQPIYYVYDNSNRLRYSQDGNQRNKGEWTTYAYDSLFRLAYSCEVELLIMPATQLRQAVSSLTNVTYYSGEDGILGGYTNVIPYGIISEINTINYYDHYRFLELYSDDKESLEYKTVKNYDWRYTDTINPRHVNWGMLTGSVTSVIGDSILLPCANYYDRKGRLIQSCEKNHLGGYDRKMYRLSFSGNPISLRHEHSTADTSCVDIYSFSYDIQLRPTSVSLSHNGSESMQEFSNTYNLLGQLSSQSLGEGMIETSYQYNIQGWNTHIENDKFRQRLYYETHPSNGTKCLTGNICAMSWASDGKDNGGNIAPAIQRTYLYEYDRLDRLTSAEYEEDTPRSDFTYQTTNAPDYSTSYAYDLNNNITALCRKGLASRELADTYELWTFDEIDNVVMTYDGNQLRKINDATDDVILSSSMDITDREHFNSYDSNGNLSHSPDKDIWEISYNRLNLPELIVLENNNRIRFKYDSNGRKLSEIYEVYHFGYPPSLELEPLTVNEPQATSGYYTEASHRDYCGNYIYQNGKVSMVSTPAGYISGNMRYYYLKDYQGNNRVVLNQNGVVQQVNHYYPYGSLMGEGFNASSQPYRYGGKELVTLEGLNISDFGARWLDSPSGSFTTMDPLCENFTQYSPYIYSLGNPIKYIDPNGMDVTIVGGSNSIITIVTDLIKITVDVSSLGIDWGGQYKLQGEDLLSATLDLAGVVDPTGIADATNVALLTKKGDYLGAVISGCGLLPYLGDLAKIAKVKGDIKIIETAIAEAKSVNKTKYQRQKAVKQAWENERKYVIRNNRGTQEWSEAEMVELIRTGKVNGYEGHHINSVKNNPELVGTPGNIIFMKRGEHLKTHGGNWRNQTEGELVDRSK